VQSLVNSDKPPYTHGDIYFKSRSFAAALMQIGLQRQTIGAVYLQNVPEYPIAVLGLMEAGLVPTLIDPNFTAGKTLIKNN